MERVITKWEKIGLIFTATDIIEGFYGAAVPCQVFLGDDIYRFYYTARDADNQSHIFYIDYDIENKAIKAISKRPVLRPGELGCFDDSGTMSSWVGKENDQWLMYYIGWNLGKTVPFRNSIGFATSKDGINFTRVGKGPVLDRSLNEPHFCASSWVIHEGEKYKMWYLSCVKWEIVEGAPQHWYHIKYAESNDGVNWVREGKVCIDFKNDNEYAISRPCVIKFGDMYRMWYSYRGDRYRIGYAESMDGVQWERKDEQAGITVSEKGFDSEMICYPCVFQAKNEWYMLYNGNGYGMSGMGLARLRGSFYE